MKIASAHESPFQDRFWPFYQDDAAIALSFMRPTWCVAITKIPVLRDEVLIRSDALSRKSRSPADSIRRGIEGIIGGRNAVADREASLTPHFPADRFLAAGARYSPSSEEVQIFVEFAPLNIFFRHAHVARTDDNDSHRLTARCVEG